MSSSSAVQISSFHPAVYLSHPAAHSLCCIDSPQEPNETDTVRINIVYRLVYPLPDKASTSYPSAYSSSNTAAKDSISNSSSLLAQRVTVPDQLTPKGSVNLTGLRPCSNSEYMISSSNPFVAKKHSKKKYCLIWGAKEEIGARHVEAIVKRAIERNESVHINTGTHGDKETGDTVYETQNPRLAEGAFLVEDFRASLNRGNVSIHVVSTDSAAIYPTKANHIILAWCYSRKFDKFKEFTSQPHIAKLSGTLQSPPSVLIKQEMRITGSYEISSISGCPITGRDYVLRLKDSNTKWKLNHFLFINLHIMGWRKGDKVTILHNNGKCFYKEYLIKNINRSSMTSGIPLFD